VKKFSAILLSVVVLLSLALIFVLGMSLANTKPKTVSPSTAPATKEKVSVDYSIKSKELLEEYNVIVLNDEKRKVCGGTVIESSEEAIRVLTAFHCINTDDEKIIPFGFIKIEEEVYRVEIEHFRRSQDLALLKVTDSISPLPKAANIGNEIVYGENVWIVGYGAAEEDIISHGTVAKVNSTSRWSGTHVSIIDGTAYYGNSGGGIYNEEDEIIGVLIEFGPAGPGLWMYAVHVDEVHKLIEEANNLPLSISIEFSE